MGALQDFHGSVLSAFGDIVAQRHLKVVALDANTVLLASRNWGIAVALSRDGVDLEYYCILPSHELLRYDLFHFLVRVRGFNPQNSVGVMERVKECEDDRFDGELASCASALLEKGQDVLEGSKEWMSAYPLQPWLIRGRDAKEILSALR